MGGSRSLSNILERASHSAFVTGEWYIPGHRLMGLRDEEEEWCPSMADGGGTSKGEANVETTEMMVLDGEEFKSMKFGNWEIFLRIELFCEDMIQRAFNTEEKRAIVGFQFYFNFGCLLL